MRALLAALLVVSACSDGATVAPQFALAAGGTHSCLRRADGTLTCWGGNFEGQLGDGTTTDRWTPITPLASGDVADVCTGFGHTCVATRAGTVRCWGDGAHGQLGGTVVASPTTA